MTSKGQDKIYAMRTEQYADALKTGRVPWHQGWAAGGAPRSMATRDLYRGSNVWPLAMTAALNGYTSPWWGTYDQITRQGGQVRAGAHGTMIVKWKRRVKVERNKDTGKDERRVWWNMFYFKVHNADTAVGLPEKWYPQPGDEPEPVPEAELILKGYLAGDDAPGLAHDGGGRAYYSGALDEIHLPARASFEDADHLYGTMFHEAAHSTGHESRLNRPGIAEFDHFGSGRYAREELAAEMTAGFLAAITGTDGHFDNSAAYVRNWLGALQDNPRMVMQAGGQAAKAADMIQGITWPDEEE